MRKQGQIRAAHVRGMGDVTFRGFQCLNAECETWIFVREDQLSIDFEIDCPRCQTQIRAGDEFAFYDYELEVKGQVVEHGRFTVLVDDYIAETERYKYCIICNTLKPLGAFDHHSSRKSGRQGECRLCKRIYNSIKNQTRTTDQHREAAQRRRLYLDIASSERIDGEAIRRRFRSRCFNCNIDLHHAASESDRPLDHTLPISLLWPLTTDNATLLCRNCNSEKAGKWPGQFYTSEQLARLSNITGVELDTLRSDPHFNPDAIERLSDTSFVDQLLVDKASRMDELIQLRNRILEAEGLDFFDYASQLSGKWRLRADALRA